MKQVNIYDARTHLCSLLRRVALGEEVTIANRGVPVARLVPIPPNHPRKLGIFRGQITISDDFDAPLPNDILDAFEGRHRRVRKTP